VSEGDDAKREKCDGAKREKRYLPLKIPHKLSKNPKKVVYLLNNVKIIKFHVTKTTFFRLFF
jgi:hypothetical protein